MPTISAGTLPLVTSNVLPMGFSFGKTVFAPVTDETNVSAFHQIVVIKIASRNERDSPCFEITRHNIVTRGASSLVHRRNITICPRVQRAVPTGEWNIAAHRRVLDSRRVVQRSEDLLRKTLP